MTAVKRPTLTGRGRVLGEPRLSRRLPAGLADAARQPDRLAFAVPLAVGFLGVVVACLALFVNSTDGIMVPLLGLLAVAVGLAAGVEKARTAALDRPALVLAVVALGATVLVSLLPTWMYGGNVNGIVHRTVVSGPLLMLLGTATMTHAIRRLLRTSPSGQDLALVPVFGLAILLGVVGYLIILAQVVVSGLGSFRFDLLATAWHQDSTARGFTYSLGFLNNILGTLLLIGLTLAFAILPGVGAGVFMSEYPGRMARLINFCTTMLRAIAMFIIGATAFALVRQAGGLDSASVLSLVVRGGFNDGTQVQPERGSYVLAAMFLAMLVMPVIARLTEEGLRSVPREIREGAVALGASDGYDLRRILLPWAAPNILTALILAGAEAAGGLAIVMFLAGVGQDGVSPLGSVTTLDYAVFATLYGPRVYIDTMRHYTFTAALLLLVLTVGLTLIAMVLQRRFARRYRGSITAQ